jgi:hypothetical protein
MGDWDDLSLEPSARELTTSSLQASSLTATPDTIMSSRPKPAAAPARPAGRYFKGKAPTNEHDDSDSDEDDHEQEEDDLQPKQEDVGGDLLASTSSRGAPAKGMNVSLGKMGVTKDGKVTGAKQEGQSSSHCRPPRRSSSELTHSLHVISARHVESSSEEEESSEEEDVKPKFRAPIRPGQPAPADEVSPRDHHAARLSRIVPSNRQT